MVLANPIYGHLRIMSSLHSSFTYHEFIASKLLSLTPVCGSRCNGPPCVQTVNVSTIKALRVKNQVWP